MGRSVEIALEDSTCRKSGPSLKMLAGRGVSGLHSRAAPRRFWSLFCVDIVLLQRMHVKAPGVC